MGLIAYGGVNGGVNGGNGGLTGGYQKRVILSIISTKFPTFFRKKTAFGGESSPDPPGTPGPPGAPGIPFLYVNLNLNRSEKLFFPFVLRKVFNSN